MGGRILRRRTAGARAENEQLRQRIGSQPVSAVDAHARDLTGRVQPGQGRSTVDVGVDPSHHVVDDRPHRDQLLDWVDILVFLTQLAHKRNLGVDDLPAQMPQVEVNHRAVGAIDGPPFLHLLHERLRQTVPRPQLHAPQNRFRLRRAQVVVLQVAVAVFVEQPASLGPRRLGDEDAGEREARRVILDELHVLERGAGRVGQRHAVAGLDAGVGGERKHAAATARAQNDGFGQNRLDLAGHQLDRHDALDPAIIDQELCHEPLVVANDARVFE